MRMSLVRAIGRWVLPIMLGVVVGAGGMQVLHAQTPPMKRTPLKRADLTGVDGKEVLVTLIEAQPKPATPLARERRRPRARQALHEALCT